LGSQASQSAKLESRFVSNLKAPPVHKVIVAQLAAAGLMTLISLFISGTIMAYSVLLGGLISALPNSYFALHAFKFQGARNAQRVVRSFIKGELGKIIITLVLFALSFTLISNLDEPALILGFIVTHFIGVMMSGMVINNPAGNKT